jgi:hypothetical protein
MNRINADIITPITMHGNSLFIPPVMLLLAVPPTTRRKLLPEIFEPSPYTVIIGKGNLPAQALGNRRLKVLVRNQLETYFAATKTDKTVIVSKIIDAVRESCPEGGAFCHFDGQQWWEADDQKARYKVSATFRNGLEDKYESSSKNKVAKRRARRKAVLKRGSQKEAAPTTVSNVKLVLTVHPEKPIISRILDHEDLLREPLGHISDITVVLMEVAEDTEATIVSLDDEYTTETFASDDNSTSTDLVVDMFTWDDLSADIALSAY